MSPFSMLLALVFTTNGHLFTDSGEGLEQGDKTKLLIDDTNDHNQPDKLQVHSFDTRDSPFEIRHAKVLELDDFAPTLQKLRKLKIYVPPKEAKYLKRGTTSCNGTHFQPFPEALPIAPPSSSILSGVGKWMWSHTEYTYTAYLEHRLSCQFTILSDIRDADLCFPSCTDFTEHKEGPRMIAMRPSAILQRTYEYAFSSQFQNMQFGVPVGRRDMWSNCTMIRMAPEAGRLKSIPGSCDVVIPYAHGVYWPNNATEKPWDLPSKRTSKLVFFGGSWRGRQNTPGHSIRKKMIGNMLTMSKRTNPQNPEAVFRAPVVMATHEVETTEHWGQPDFYLKAYEAYATAECCWHPTGDTPTRRGFFDSLMMGCVPVIEKSAADQYSQMFRNLIFDDCKADDGRCLRDHNPRLKIEDLAVVLPKEIEEDGEQIVAFVLNISNDAIRQRQALIKKTAVLFQWGWEGPSDSLLMALSSVMHRK